MNYIYQHKNGIALRKFEKSDLPSLLNNLNETWYGRHTIAINNMEDQVNWFTHQNSNSFTMMAVDVKGISKFPVSKPINGEPVGIYRIASINWINRSGVSSHDVFPRFQGNGYGKPVLEAGVDFVFEVLNLRRIDTEVLSNNIASQKTAHFVGYVEEGLKRQAVVRCGDVLDSIVYGLLRDDWEKLPRVLKYKGVCNTSYTPKNSLEA